MYTLESLGQINGRYRSDHMLNQSDVDKVNLYVKMIENSRCDDKPMPGDILRLTDKHGRYYPFAHIERDSSYEDGCLDVCEQAYTPFVNIQDDGKQISMSTSGGAWPQIPNNVKLVGKGEKYFCVWGSSGPRANGAVNFLANVNVWEYVDPDALYGQYTTKDYDQLYVSRIDKPNDTGYMIFASSGGMSKNAFRNDLDYEVWKRTYKAIEFTGHWPNQKVVFIYRHRTKPVTKEEWLKLDLPLDTRIWNGSKVKCKFAYDDITHELIDYSYADGQMKSGGYSAYYCGDLELDWFKHEPYEYQRRLMGVLV